VEEGFSGENTGGHEPFRVSIEGFEGPLDLLLHLVRRGDMDVLDLPIARLTQEYLDFISFMKEINIDVAGTFLLMASTLVHIKSRALLPPDEKPAEDEDDPRMEIARPLIDYMKVRDAADMLQNREILGRDVFVRPYQPPEEEGEEQVLSTVSVFDLLEAFKRLLEARPEEPMVVHVDEDSVGERIERLSRMLLGSGGLPFVALFPRGAARREIITTFLALLEMVKGGAVRLIQDERGNISVLPPLAGVA